MINPNDIFQIRSLLQNAQSVLIVLGESGQVDTVAAGLGLYLSLTKTGKQITIVSPEKTKVELSYLFGVDKISNTLSGGNKLVVSLPYQEGDVERVSYNIANNKFNLVIEPRGEKLNFDPKQIEYHYGNGSPDLIFTLGVASPQSLGGFWQNQSNLFSQKPIINIGISTDNKNTGYGKINLLDNTSLSQTVAFVLRALRLPLDQDIASNLLTGLASVEPHLDLEKTSPDVLEITAFLLRGGGKVLKFPQKTEVLSSSEESKKSPLPPAEEKTPSDWLKPKIFTTDKNTRLV